MAVRVRCYFRVSTDEQAASGFSLAAQREKLAAFALSQGWTVAGFYSDEGVSAKDTNRPEFQRMMREVLPGEVILVYKLDRLTRSVRDLDDLLKEFDNREIKFRSVTEQFDTTTATGRLFIRMIAEMAQWERETIGERTMFGKAKRARSGRWPGGKAPFGYTTMDSGDIKAGRILKRLVPDPTRAHLIPLIFEKYLSGYGVRAIAVWLNNDLKIAPLEGKQFASCTISQMLRNPIYMGDVVYGRKQGVERIASDHVPLITREMFDRVQAVMATRKRMTPRQATGNYLLSGIAVCGQCGGPVHGNRGYYKTISGRKPYLAYRCSNYEHGKNCGSVPFISAATSHVDAALLNELNKLGLPDTIEEFNRQDDADWTKRHETDEIDAVRIHAELDELRFAVAQWDSKFEKGRISEEEHEEKTRVHIERIKVLREQLNAIESKKSSRTDWTMLSATLGNLHEDWEVMTYQERKIYVKNLVDHFGLCIKVFPDRRVKIERASL